MQCKPDLPVPIQVFIVFYAIAWGALANALPRWRAFDTSRFWADDFARRRIVLSVFVLNILPPCYFAVWLAYFGSNPGWEITLRWGWRTFFAVFVPAIAAWAAPFGFHRLFVWIVQRQHQHFYPTYLRDADWEREFPGLRKDDLSSKWAPSNLFFAMVYFAVSVGLPCVFFCTLKSR